VSARGRRLVATALLLAVVAIAERGAAHILYERATLREWTQQADLVVVAEFATGAQVWRAPDGSDRQDWFQVRIVETLRGDAAGLGETLDFFPHAEGFPAFQRGDRALLFLGRSGERSEFAELASRFRWVSGQGAGHEWILSGADGHAIVEIARRWIALQRDATGNSAAAFRDRLLAELASGVAALRTDALRELIVARSVPGFLDVATTAAFADWAAAPGLPASQRLALVRMLDGAPGFDANQQLRALAGESLEGPVLAQLLQIAAASQDPALRAWAVSQAEDPRPAVQRAANGALARAATRPAIP
jgi:hypothetical protein